MSRILGADRWFLGRVTGYGLRVAGSELRVTRCVVKPDLSEIHIPYSAFRIPHSRASVFLQRIRHVEQSGSFIESHHNIHILDCLPGGSFDKVVNG
jgi:hypothetical protein